jgi:thiamine biosynthesis lipoprotein
MGVFFLFLSLVGCQRQTQSVSKTTYALDTIIQITLYDSQEESLIDDCFALCSEYEKKFSRTKEESEIYKLNQDGEADVSRETLELIQKGLYYSELSKGMFDITIEPVSSLWNFTVEDEDATLPNENDIKRAIKKVDYTKVKIDGNHVSFLEEGMGIDLGAIAKGYIADRLKEYLLAHEVGSAVINLGGNVLCIGKNVDGEDFSIGVQKPEKNSSEISAVLLIDDKSVVSSGTYERYITVDGVDYHHILNPKTGYSYQNGLSEVTIISNQSVDGDGLSTTCFALGIEEGIKLLNSIEDTCGMFIDESGETYYSDGFEEYIKNH